MKKAALAIIGLTMACAASAQYVSTRKVGQADGWTEFTTGNMKMVGIEPRAVTIYNDDFTVAKKIVLSIPESEYVTYMRSMTYATQHLFNTDDLYEVVVKTPSGQLKIYNENNELLGEIPPAQNILNVGGTPYLYAVTYDENNRYVITVYAIESKTNSIVSVRKIDGIKIYPTAVNQGEQIRVELPEGSKADINLYNASGIIELQRSDARGAFEIPTDALSRGVHPYNVTDDNGNSRTGKIIVK